MNINTATWLNNVSEYFFSIKFKEIESLKKKGANIINLGIGNPIFKPPIKVIKKLQKSAELPKANMYQSYNGIESLRDSISKWYLDNYKIKLNPENEILPLIGSKEGIMYISMTYLNENDQVLIPDPGYPTYTSVSKMLRAKIIYYNLLKENFWLPDFNVLNKKNLSKVKILWVNYPHMPTGAKINYNQLKEIVDFAIKNKILLVYDNPYNFILNKNPLSIFQINGAKKIALELNSLSKIYNMPGWRIGMVVGNKDFIKNILITKSQVHSGMYFPIQMGAVQALKESKEWIKKLNIMYSERKKIVYDICNILNLSYESNSAGIFVWAKIMNNKNDKNWSDDILYKYHIFITPGSIFGNCGKGYVRISLCSSLEELKTAKERIKL